MDIKNENGNSARPSQPGAGTNLSQRFEQWKQFQGRPRLIVFWLGYLIQIIMDWATAIWLGHTQPADPGLAAGLFAGIALGLMLVWPLIALRWRKFKWGTHKTTAPKLLLTLAITGWVSCYLTLANAGTITQASAPHIAHATQLAAAATIQAKPKQYYCILWFILGILIVAIAIVGAIWYMLCQLGFCGKTGNKPPQSPGGNDNDNVRPDGGVVNPAVSLPTSQFFYSGGIMLSNSAGLNPMGLPSFFTVNGKPLPMGSQIQSHTPGLTTPPSIGLWMETNAYFDANLDPTYPYAGVYNFSVLTTTNLAAGWGELCTIVGWVNENPVTPLICYITYTNNVPEQTNWAQAHLSNFGQLTNLVVYGNLPDVSAITAHPKLMPHIRYDGIPDPTNPTNTCTNCPVGAFLSSGHFFKLVCNTNAISTGIGWMN